MGLAALLTRSSPNYQPATPAGPTPGPEQRWGAPTILPSITESSALSVPAFWAAYRYVTGSVGQLPVTAFRDTEALDPQPPFVRQPDPFQTPMAFWSGVAASLTLYGNSICIITERDRLGYATTVKPIHPLMVAVRFTGNPMAPNISEFYCAGQLYDPSQIWHVKSHLARPGWPLGRGVIDMMSDAIGTELATQGYSASFFVSGGMPIGILKIHRPEITQAQADQAKTDWLSKFSGAPTPAVLNELTDFCPLAYRPVDSQMVESRQFGLIQVALMWGLPPSKLGSAIANPYKNAQNEEIQARNDAVSQWTNLLEQAISIDCLPRGQRVEWDLNAALRTDTLSQYQAYQLALGGPGPQSAWLLVDEVRAEQNKDPMAVTEAELKAATAQVAADRLLELDAEPEPGAPALPVAPSVAGVPAVPNPPPTGTVVPAPTNGKGG